MESVIIPDALQHFHGFVGLPSMFNPVGFFKPVSAEFKAWFESHKLDTFADEVDDDGAYYFSDMDVWDHICEGVDIRGFELIVGPN